MLVSVQDIIIALKLKKWGVLGYPIARLAMYLSKISKINRLYSQRYQLSPHDFIQQILIDFNINYIVSPKSLKKIPREGGFITVSNHPLGGVDGICLIDIMTKIRKDYRVMANFLLTKIKPISPYIISVNSLKKHNVQRSSSGGFKAAISHIREEKPMGFFPAGEVSTTLKDIAIDKPWDNAAIKLIKKMKTPIIPVYFHAKNSPLFYKLAKYSPLLQTAKLPSELFSQKNQYIQVVIGDIISIDEQNKMTIDEFGEYIREKTYQLEKQCQ